MTAPVTPWDGVPVNSERDGWHVVNGAPKLWDAHKRSWQQNDGVEFFCAPPTDAARWNWTYAGPVRTDTDLAAAWINGRHEAVGIISQQVGSWGRVTDNLSPLFDATMQELARRVLQLTPPPDLGAALATALEQARKEEREAIAEKARQLADHYPQSSDGRNTFILLAEWIEARTPTTGGLTDG